MNEEVVANVIHCPRCNKRHPYDTPCAYEPLSSEIMDKVIEKLTAQEGKSTIVGGYCGKHGAFIGVTCGKCVTAQKEGV
jgi:hypothetical protein